MSTKRALITGITGQDGAYLAKFLLEKDYEVYGLYRRTSSPNLWRLLSLNIFDQIHLIPGDMTDMASLTNAIIQSQPQEIYNLAAQSFVGSSFDQPIATAMVDGLGTASLLESVKLIDNKIRLYHASTSELYGNGKESIQESQETFLDENTVFWPVSPYATAKLYAYQMVRVYREAYGLFSVNGILFNHESPLRGMEFVTRKITNALARIKLGLQENVILGNLEAERDWGYAPEYVEAMWLMLQQEKPQDFVIATGEKHSVKEFIEIACKTLELDPAKIIVQDKKFLRPLDVNYLIGDALKAKKILGWESKTSCKQLVKIMINEDLQRWKDHLNGKIFPWDAINFSSTYTNKSKIG